MKKIISIILAITCAFALFSCGETGKAIKKIDKMYKSTAPTKIVIEETQKIGEIILVTEANFVTGKIDGKKAAIYEYRKQELRAISDGDQELSAISEETGKHEYLEGTGYRVDGGKWQDEYDFAPKTGAIALEFSEKDITDFKEDKDAKSYTFIIPADNTEKVLGKATGADVTVVIIHDGAAIAGIALTYTITAENSKHDNTVVTIKAKYTYETEDITIQ